MKSTKVKNVIFSSDVFPENTKYFNWEENKLKKILKKTLKIKKNF